MKKIKEKIMAMNSKTEKRITMIIVGYCALIIASIIFTSITKKFEIAIDITQYIGLVLLIIWSAVLAIRRRDREVVMKNKIVNIILSDRYAVMWYTYLITITILRIIISKISIKMSSIILLILVIIVVIGIEVISNNVSQYFDKKLN